jgi:predicted Fe-S protein YdhL (DUF1289 family)
MSSSIPNSEVASPCVRSCCLDDDDVCVGCGRALHEIVAWGTADDATRRAILERSRERVTQRAQRHG